METAIAFYVNNPSTIDISTGDAIKGELKKIDQIFHHIRDQFNLGFSHIQYISTHEMKANFLTKPWGPTDINHALNINRMSAAWLWRYVAV